MAGERSRRGFPMAPSLPTWASRNFVDPLSVVGVESLADKFLGGASRPVQGSGLGSSRVDHSSEGPGFPRPRAFDIAKSQPQVEKPLLRECWKVQSDRLNKEVEDANRNSKPYEGCLQPFGEEPFHVKSEADFARGKNKIRIPATNPLAGILDANKLIGPNFEDWLRNLKIVLQYEKLAYILETDEPELPALGATQDVLLTYNKWKEDANRVHCYMLASMSNDLQQQHENMSPKAMMLHLLQMYTKSDRTQIYEISKSLFSAHMSEGSSIQTHVLRMLEWMKKLAVLGLEIPNDLSVDLVLKSLPESFSRFVANVYMKKIPVSLNELPNMLMAIERSIQEDKPQVLISGTNKKRKAISGYEKSEGKKLVKGVAKRKMMEVSEKGECFHCGVKGHWKRNCTMYLREIAQNKKHASPSRGKDN